MKKRILVISQYFYPENFRINDICEEWVKRGYHVTVLTGIPNYPQGRYFEGYGLFKNRRENYKGIDIVRIPLTPRGHNAITLALNYLSFVISGFFWAFFTRMDADYVFIFEVSPMTQALPGVWFAKRRKIPCYLYVQDLWPENFEVLSGIKSKWIIRVVGSMVDYIYARCTKIFTTSRSFIHAIAGRGVERSKLEYWPQYAEDFYQPLPKSKIKEIPDDDSFNLIFTGNIGASQGLDILPLAAEILLGRPHARKIRFNIVGDGRYKETLIEMVHSRNVAEVFNFIPKQPADRIPLFLAAADAAIICLDDSPLFSKTIPAKLQSYMACGIPIIASASGETSAIVKEANAGLCCAAGDPEALANAIEQMAKETPDALLAFGRNAKRYCELNFDKETLLDKIDEYFQ